jgi:hypothetical protein
MNLGSILLKGLVIFLVAAVIIGGFLMNQGQIQWGEPIEFVLSVVEGAQAFALDYLPWLIIGSLLVAAGWSAVDQRGGH